MPTVKFYSYCGMQDIPVRCENVAKARRIVAQRLRDRRSEGFKIVTLRRGHEWEILEPPDCLLVPDEAGVLLLGDDDAEPSRIESYVLVFK